MKLVGHGKFGISMLSDSDPRLISKKGLETYLGHFPCGVSYNAINHYRQIMVAKKFQMLDHGCEKNYELYNDNVPPAYDFKVKNFPIAILGGINDNMSSPIDFRWLRDHLSETDSCVFYKEYEFGHLGFLIPPNNDYFFELLEICNHFLPNHKLEAKCHEADLEKQAHTLVKSQIAANSVKEIHAMLTCPKPE